MKEISNILFSVPETILKWLTFAIAVGGLSLGVVNFCQSMKIQEIEKEIRIERLLGEATDLIYFNENSINPNETIPPRQLELAGRKINEALIINPNNAKAHKLASIYLIEKKQYNDSLVHLSKAVSLTPNDPYLYYLYGRNYLENDQHLKAIEYLNKAISIDSNLINAHIALGSAYFNLKKYNESTNVFMKAVELDPNIPETHYNLGYINYFQGRLEKAREQFCKVKTRF